MEPKIDENGVELKIDPYEVKIDANWSLESIMIKRTSFGVAFIR